MASRVMAGSPVEEQWIRDQVEVSREEGWSAFLQGFESFIRFRISLYRFSPEDAEDVFQEVCLRLAKDDSRLLREWDPNKAPLSGYLGVITSSVCLSFLKSAYYSYSRRKVSLSDTEWRRGEVYALLEDTAPTPEERLSRLERLERIETLLESWMRGRSLSAEDCLLVRLRIGGMSYREASNILGISLVNAKVRFHRLKEDLARFLLGPSAGEKRAHEGRRRKSPEPG
ncbi:MAG: hypothetical protein GHCLOJNM_03245 [bacterium]|nr:hypothetical protein [bacterium]